MLFISESQDEEHVALFTPNECAASVCQGLTEPKWLTDAFPLIMIQQHSWKAFSQLELAAQHTLLHTVNTEALPTCSHEAKVHIFTQQRCYGAGEKRSIFCYPSTFDVLDKLQTIFTWNGNQALDTIVLCNYVSQEITDQTTFFVRSIQAYTNRIRIPF